MHVREFAKHIEGPTRPVYLFCPGKAGPRARETTFEPVLADRAVERIVQAQVDPENRDFGFAAYYADETSPGEIVLDARTLPFLAERRVVLVRNAERYNTESAAGAMLDYLAEPNDVTTLLLVANKIDRRTKFFKTCQQAGDVVECPALSENEVTEWVREEAARREKDIDAGAVRELIDRSGTHLSDVENAFVLVSNYVDEGARITKADVVAACADVAEEEIWALTDAIAASRSGDALAALRNLMELGKHPDEIIGTINWLLKSAYMVAIATGEPSISRFVAQKVRPLKEKLGVVKLRAAFALCTDTQFMMRNTGVDSALALELLVVKLATPIRRRQSA